MSFFALPKQLQWAAWLALGFAAWVTWDLSHWWSLREDYSFGYIVPLFVAYVIYDRWPRLAGLVGVTVGKPATQAGGDAPTATATVPEAPPAVSPSPARSPLLKAFEVLALLGLLWGLLCFGFGALYRASEGSTLPGSFLMTVSWSWLFLVGAFFFADRTAQGLPLTLGARLRFSSLLLFPALIWIISAPLMSFAETAVSTFLLNKVTTVVFFVFDGLGYTIERAGSVLRLPKGEVGVEEACSGIRSLTACLFAGSFLAATFLDRFWKKVLMVAMALVLAVFTNLLRSLFLTSWAYAYGSHAIEGTVHDVTGYAVLGVTVVLLLCLIPIFNFKWELPDDEEPAQPAEAPPATEEEPVQAAPR